MGGGSGEKRGWELTNSGWRSGEKEGGAEKQWVEGVVRKRERGRVW